MQRTPGGFGTEHRVTVVTRSRAGGEGGSVAARVGVACHVRPTKRMPGLLWMLPT